MKALRCAPPGMNLEMNVEIPQPAPGEVLVKVRMAGICRTDLELTRGYMGFKGILGHEFVGQVDSRSYILSGTRVVGEINAGCGKCEACLQNLQRHCPYRSVLGILNREGCMAEWLTLPEENLVAVPDEIPDEKAVFTEPLAAALEIFEQLHITPDARVCIIGDGKLGLLIAMAFAFRHEGETLLVGHHSKKMAVVEDLVGTAMERNLSDSWYKRWDVVVDATGSTSGLQLALQLVRPRGTVVLKSTMAEAEALDLTPLVIDEIQMMGSRCGQFRPAISFMVKHPIPLKRLIEEIYPFEQAQAAWEHASRKGARKIILKM